MKIGLFPMCADIFTCRTVKVIGSNEVLSYGLFQYELSY